MPREEDHGFTIDKAKRIGKTDKAIKVEADFFDTDFVWIPISQVHPDSEVYEDDDGTPGKLVVTSWWAEKQEWEHDD